MSIVIHVHDRNPNALAELLVATMNGGALIDREPMVAHLSALVDRAEKEGERRRAAWHWLNSLSDGMKRDPADKSGKMIDRDNDWSEL